MNLPARLAPMTDAILAETVKPLGVHAYLAANGWTRIGPCHGDTGDVYRLHEDEHEAVLVPASATFADYVTRIVQLAEILGRVENRRRTAVLTDLSLAGVDLIRIRLPEAHDDSSIPLSAGVDLLQESRKLLLAAACSASRPQRMFRAGRHQQAAAYVDKVRLGQTEPGSFVVNMLAPISPSLRKPEPTQLPRWTRSNGGPPECSSPVCAPHEKRRCASIAEKISVLSRSGSARVSVRTCAGPPPI